MLGGTGRDFDTVLIGEGYPPRQLSVGERMPRRRSNEPLRARAWRILGVGLEIQRSRVETIAQARRLRPIGKDMPQMRVARRADDLGAAHPKRLIVFHAHVFRRHRLPERWPAGARLELGLGRKKRRAAADTTVRALVVMVPVLAGECALGSLSARHVELFGRQLRLPIRVRLVDFVGHLLSFLWMLTGLPSRRGRSHAPVSYSGNFIRLPYRNVVRDDSRRVPPPRCPDHRSRRRRPPVVALLPACLAAALPAASR